MATYQVKIENINPMQVVSKREVVANYGAVGGLLTQLITEMEIAGVQPDGPSMAIYFDTEYRERDVDVEVAFPVAQGEAIPGDGISSRTLGGGPFAVVNHHGAYDDFTPVYQELMDWIQANGYRIIGPNREIYVQGPDTQGDPADYMTQIMFPVTSA